MFAKKEPKMLEMVAPSSQVKLKMDDGDTNSEQVSNREIVSSYIHSEGITKTLTIGISSQEPALSVLNYPFYQSVPLIILSIFQQIHVIYLLGITPLLLFKYQWIISYQMLIIQTTLFLTYISIEFISRVLTFKHYKKTNSWNQKGNYYVWSSLDKCWKKKNQKDIKIGDIMRIQFNLSEDEDQNQLNRRKAKKIMAPVNMLPIKTHSGGQFVQVDNFQTHKNEATFKVPIIPFFEDYIEGQDTIKSSIESCRIDFIFQSQMGQSLQAKIMFSGRHPVGISNEDIIQRGAFLLNERAVIGIALKTFEEKKMKYLKKVLRGSNNIANFLSRHIKYTFIINIGTSWVIIAILSLAIVVTGSQNFSSKFPWFFLNYFSNLCFSLNIIMFLIMSLSQIIDSFKTSYKFGFKMNNYVKSIDQFGIADTFLMDQLTLMGKDILKVTAFQIDSDSGFSHFSEQIILMVIQKSKKLNTRFQKQWLSLMNYSRTKYGNNNEDLSKEITIKNQEIDISGSIRINVEFEGKGYIIRFNEKVIFSVLQSISIEKQLMFCEQIKEAQRNGELVLMMQISREKECEEVETSFPIYELQFTFLALIKQKIQAQSEAAEFVSHLKNKFNIIIMSSDPYEYLDKVITSAGLKSVKHRKHEVMLFESSDVEDFTKKLRQRFYEYEREEKDMMESQNSDHPLSLIKSQYGKEPKDLILAFDSSLIGYFGRYSCRSLLTKMSKRCTFIIVYNCSQFQKQLCAANLLKTFPKHIFLSNFQVDQQIYRMANLSVSIKDHSGAYLATATAQSYEALTYFIETECVKSIGITTLIIRSHIFKNECLIWSLFTALGLVYQGKYFIVGMEYTTYLFFIFNTGFTIIPLIFYLSCRPKPIENNGVEEIKYHKLRYQHVKGVLTGIFTTYINFSIIPHLQMSNIFFVIMINCTFLANFYYLVLDDSMSKKIPIIIIIIQCLLSYGIFFLTQYVNVDHKLFDFELDLYPFSQLKIYLYCMVFIFNFVINILILYFLSLHRNIIGKSMKVLREEKVQQEINKELDKQEYIVGRIGRSSGMNMRFRISDARPRVFESNFVQ